MNDVMYSTILFTSSAVDTEFTGLHVTPQDEVRYVYIVTTSHNYACRYRPCFTQPCNCACHHSVLSMLQSV